MPETLANKSGLLNDLTVGPRTGPQWLADIRNEASRSFAQIGLPTRHDEDWRYTPVSAIAETNFRRPGREVGDLVLGDIEKIGFPEMHKTRLVFINGYYRQVFSWIHEDHERVVSSLSDAIKNQPGLVQPHLARYAAFDTHPFVALNTASLTDGVFIHLPRNVQTDGVIHILNVSTSPGVTSINQPRLLVVAEENSHGTIVESFAGQAGQRYLCNAVTEIVVGPNAVIDHYKIQRESPVAFHLGTLQVQLDRGSTFSSHSIAFGGQIVRSDNNAVFAGERAECTLNGLYRATGDQIVDNHTSIDHAVPNCNSHELYKGIIDGHARGVFNGKIFVRQDAQKTDAKQTNQTLLLSDEAQINTKPQLEIFADDVKCTHGATVGQLSKEAFFYLRARGIPADQARNLLVYAFASDIVSRIRVADIRLELDHILLAERALQGLE